MLVSLNRLQGGVDGIDPLPGQFALETPVPEELFGGEEHFLT